MIRVYFDWLRTTDFETKKKVLSLVAFGLITTLIAIGSVIFILRSQNSSGGHVKETQSETLQKSSQPEHPKGSYSLSYEINQVSMAMMNRAGTKTAYAQFSLILDCPSEESKKVLAMNRAKLLDAIFLVGSGFFLDDFSGQKAEKSFDKFKSELIKKYQSDFQALAPREIALKDWIVN